MSVRLIKVVIADGHPLFRAGLRHIIAGHERLELVGEAGDGEAALKLIHEKKPDVAVLDVNLSGPACVEIARRLHGGKTPTLPTRLVVLTSHNEEEIVGCALDTNAMALVLKENAVEEIGRAIVVVADGGHYLSPTIGGLLVRRRGRAEQLAAQKPGLDDLTKAERRILKLIAEKKTSREIAALLFISPRTVEAHRANISAKLELHGSHSLLQFALENRSSL